MRYMLRGIFAGYGLLTLPLQIISTVIGAYLLICEIVGIIVVTKWIIKKLRKK